ncbi:uncharacterized protein DUF1488 [Neorhizobium sp. R1-B]|jgi:hypothetical protein|uniref:DUF1488 domain-containing protein n=1 Tax=Neorhizobium sp. R1-B TaxID=2485162 RepID=UPI000DD7668D|nr:DUF1488 domain-containing protein [Neorhizobium sp. R1-B]TDX85025.1 uncharacterized protein DUF1488 [Neorhizobium sp. R1-B]
MALSFLNPARSYDETHRRVRFLGHDGMFEVRFFVSGDVLADKLCQRTASADDYLASFDALRPRIQRAAATVYAKTPKSTIVLDLENFR